MKPLFSSLGSNYRWSDLLLLVTGMITGRREREELGIYLENRFGGEVELVYKGRDAIERALLGYGVGAGDKVLTQAFACSAIEEAILRTGAEPAYVDVEPDHLSFSLAQLQQQYKRNSSAKAVIIQYTLGSTYDTKALQKWCTTNGLFLIEDLAQGLGGEATSGELLGSFGDAVVLSFGRDKMVDAVTGGAVIFRTPKKVVTASLKEVPLRQHVRDCLYPFIVLVGTATFQVGFGKLWLWLAKRLNLLSSPTYSSTSSAHKLPSIFAPLIRKQFSRLTQSVKHRREIAQLYLQEWPKNTTPTLLISKDDLLYGACLRVPVAMKDAVILSQVLATLQDEQFFMSDRWYRVPIDGGVTNPSKKYVKGSCVNAEKLSEVVLNLPTHHRVSMKNVRRIVALVAKGAQTYE